MVQSGAYSLRLETPLCVRREGVSGVAEEVAARRDIRLGPGDADPAVLLALSIEPEAIWSTTLAP